MPDYKITKEKNHYRITRPDGVMIDNIFADKKTDSGTLIATGRQMAERHIELLKATFGEKK